jgi:hypothetical protein
MLSGFASLGMRASSRARNPEPIAEQAAMVRYTEAGWNKLMKAYPHSLRAQIVAAFDNQEGSAQN